ARAPNPITPTAFFAGRAWSPRWPGPRIGLVSTLARSPRGPGRRVGPVAALARSLLPDPHPVDEHSRRELGRAIRRARPIAPDGQIHQQEERMVERPGCSGAQVAWGDRLIDRSVEHEAD